MKYLPIAIRQLEFALELLNRVEQGTLDDVALDYLRPASAFDPNGDLQGFVECNVRITFGAAAITLDRCRIEAGLPLPDPIQTEVDEWVALVYQVRNAFAHDIAEPVWEIRRNHHRRQYAVAGVTADLRQLDGSPFDFAAVGGAQAMLRLADFGAERVFRHQYQAIHGEAYKWVVVPL